MTHFLKQKNRPLIAGATMGLFLSLALLAINVYINAPSENSLINRGYAGGEIVAQGVPEEVAKVTRSYTGQFLKKIL